MFGIWSLFILTWLCFEVVSWIFMRRPHRLQACKSFFFSLDREQDFYLAPAKGHPILNFLPCASMATDGVNQTGHRSIGPTYGFQGTRVYLAGDCTLFDLELSADDSIGYLLQREFSKRGHCVEVANGAFAYYSSVHSITRFMLDTLRFDCHIAILMTGINDVEAFLHTGGVLEPDYSNYYRVVPTQQPLGDLTRGLLKSFRWLPSVRLYAYSKIWRQVPANWFHWNLVRQAGKTTTEQNLLKCFELFHTRNLKKNLITFIGMCRAHGITPVLATNYFRRSDMLSPQRAFIKYGIDEVNKEIRHTSAEQRVLLLDLDQDLSRMGLEIENKWHYTLAANHKRVEIIADILETHPMTSAYFASGKRDYITSRCAQ